MYIPCASICLGCSGRNCNSCSVLLEYVKRQRFVIESIDNKKDFDLENHFASGL